MTYRVSVAVSGRGSNLAALTEALAADTVAEVVQVLSDRPAPALSWARERGISAHQLTNFRDADEWLARLQESEADLLVLAGYLRLVPSGVIATYPGRILNIHPSLLPRHGGAGMYGSRVHAAVLAAGDTESGATVHLVDEVYDRGRILGQARVPVLPNDTPDTLAARVLAAEHRLLPAAVVAAALAGHPIPFQVPS